MLAKATGCRFVSKDDLGHGFIHWLADQNHTLYVRREHRKGAKDQARAIAAGLEQEQPIAVFPEGTVGPGDELLPFRSTLLEAVNLAGSRAQVRPVALDYGPAATEISWHGEKGADNVRRILGRPGSIFVTVRLLPPIAGSGDRKSVAEQARKAIAHALASSRGPADLYARAR